MGTIVGLEKPEIVNMNRLFNSNKVVWEEGVYKAVEDSDEECENLDSEKESSSSDDEEEEK